MIGMFSGTVIFSFLGCLTLGILYAWFLYRRNTNLNQTLRLVLTVLRVITVTFIAWMIFAPMLKTLNYTLEKPLIIIGQDNSASVAQIKPAAFNSSTYQQDLKTLVNRLSEKYEVKTYHFGDRVQEDFDFDQQGKQTEASMFFQRIRDEYANRNIGAIVLSTDGIFNRGGNPLYGLEQINAAVYTIALGDTIPKRDVLISNVNYNNIVYLDDDFTVEIQVQAFQSDGAQTELSIRQNTTKIQQQSIAIKGNAFLKTIPLKLHAGKVGIQKYTVQLSEVSNEITTKNNSQSFFVEVIDGRQKVLIAAAGPHPDLSVIKDGISLNKHYEAKLAIGEELNSIEPSKYDLLVLYQLPDVQNFSTAFLQKLKTIRQPLWYILGAQSNIAAFNQIQNQVNLSSFNGSMQESYPDFANSFTSFNISEEDQKLFSKFDPLLSPFGRLSVSASSMPVFYQRIGKVSTQQPLLFFTNADSRKTAYLMGEGLWRWKLAEAENNIQPSVLNDLISKTIQFLSVKDDKRRFRVSTSKPTFEENEAIQFNATLYNESYQPVNEPEVQLKVKNESGKVFNFVFSKTENGYQLNAGDMPAGNYTYQANTVFGGQKFSATGNFYVTALISEFQQTTANHHLLNTMSAQSGGKMFAPNQISDIADNILKNENIKTIRYEDRQYNELINLRLLFALILILLTTEWFLRKRNGEL